MYVYCLGKNFLKTLFIYLRERDHEQGVGAEEQEYSMFGGGVDKE